MKRALWFLGAGLVVCIAAAFFWTARWVGAPSNASRGAYRTAWSPKAAASYLDYREVWWQNWPAAQRDHGTVCISCHTVLPYALVRPALRQQLGQTALTSTERRMLESIEVRVTDWPQTSPYYPDSAHAAPSRATESILNAFILAAYDKTDDKLDPVTRHAFGEAWALQISTGANAGGWKWQNFNEAPWESSESAYQGAALMAIAVGCMPEQYRNNPDVESHVTQLESYLIRNYPAQPSLNQLYVLRASAYMPGLLSDKQRDRLIAKLVRLQQRDGGWSLASLDRQTAPKKALLDLAKRVHGGDGSDGCGTGLAILGLEKAGVGLRNPELQRGLTWLQQHQRQDGSWWATSLNGPRDASSEVGRFMSDAATGYAVLALEQARKPASASVQSGTAGNSTSATSPGE